MLQQYGSALNRAFDKHYLELKNLHQSYFGTSEFAKIEQSDWALFPTTMLIKVTYSVSDMKIDNGAGQVTNASATISSAKASATRFINAARARKHDKTEDTYAKLVFFSAKLLPLPNNPQYVLHKVAYGAHSQCKTCLGHGVHDCSRCNNHPVSTCSSCSGHGDHQCGNCNGKGESYCTQCHNGYNQCHYCTATGYITCSRCNGRGSIDIYVNGRVEQQYCCSGSQRCGSCDGGRTRCGVCSNGIAFCYACRGSGRYSCKTCQGNGKVTCAACRGAGKENCSPCQHTGFTHQLYSAQSQVAILKNILPTDFNDKETWLGKEFDWEKSDEVDRLTKSIFWDQSSKAPFSKEKEGYDAIFINGSLPYRTLKVRINGKEETFNTYAVLNDKGNVEIKTEKTRASLGDKYVGDAVEAFENSCIAFGKSGNYKQVAKVLEENPALVHIANSAGDSKLLQSGTISSNMEAVTNTYVDGFKKMLAAKAANSHSFKRILPISMMVSLFFSVMLMLLAQLNLPITEFVRSIVSWKVNTLLEYKIGALILVVGAVLLILHALGTVEYPNRDKALAVISCIVIFALGDITLFKITVSQGVPYSVYQSVFYLASLYPAAYFFVHKLSAQYGEKASLYFRQHYNW
ncbi:hypothetical protein L4C38_13510 [Vibrio kasasachensis]|uniref:hypothetical protein n=1 Tax=Vibrio kasasachensis TaxID=2910248 RepID=UPI003D12CF48